jgi:hypothetical protein
MRARPTVALRSRKASSARPPPPPAHRRWWRDRRARRRLRHRVEAVEHGLAAKLGLAPRLHRITRQRHQFRNPGASTAVSPLQRLGHRHQPRRHQRAVGRPRRLGEGLRAGQERLAQIVGQLARLRRSPASRASSSRQDRRRRARRRPRSALSKSRSIAAVSRAMAALQRGAVERHPTLQKAQSQGAFSSASNSASSLIRA